MASASCFLDINRDEVSSLNSVVNATEVFDWGKQRPRKWKCMTTVQPWLVCPQQWLGSLARPHSNEIIAFKYHWFLNGI